MQGQGETEQLKPNTEQCTCSVRHQWAVEDRKQECGLEDLINVTSLNIDHFEILICKKTCNACLHVCVCERVSVCV